MNAIIVGINGRPSILELLRTANLDVTIYSQYHKKNGNKEFWKSITVFSDGFLAFNKCNKPSFNNGDKVVFWGSRAVLEMDDAIVYNKPLSIAIASKKSLGRKIMQDAKISIPKTFFTIDDAIKFEKFPLIVRPETHHGGSQFYIANNIKELKTYFTKVNNNGYISEFYPKTKEFRIHCASGKVLLIKEKPVPKDSTIIAWNFAQNKLPWSIINRKDYDYDMVKLALDAMQAINLDFGAVDIMSYPKDKTLPKHVVTEINTAPSSTPYLIDKYSMYFKKIFSFNKKLENWTYSEFKKAKSFAWKNFQLKEEK